MLFLFRSSNAAFFDLFDDFMAIFVTRLIREKLCDVVSNAVCERAE